MAYREAPLVDRDADARETDAIRAYGAWSARLRTWVLIVASTVGLGAAALTCVVALRLWHAATDVPVPPRAAPVLIGDYVYTFEDEPPETLDAPRILYVGPAVAVFFLLAWAGRPVGRRLVAGRTPQKLAALSARYEVPADWLARTATLANRL